MSRVRRLILPALLALCGVVVLVELGNWQLRRLAWKEDLIARVNERPKAAPLDLRQAGLAEVADVAAFLQENEYRRVLIRGEYLPSDTVRVFTSIEEPRGGRFSGPGFFILTPFITTPDSARIYVNRGFVPQESGASYAAPPVGQVDIEGLIRAPERGSWFTPDPDLTKRIFYARDPQRIAAATSQVGGALGFSVDLLASATPDGGLPQAGETRITFSNDHLQYAITWYGLAAALLAIFVIYARGHLQQRDKKPA